MIKYFLRLKLLFLAPFVLAPFVLTSCLSSYVNAPQDTARVSRLLSQNEDAAKDDFSEVLPFNSKIVYSAVIDALKMQKETVVRYKYNKAYKQYHTQSFLYSVAPPDKKKGAVISRIRGFFRVQENIIMVYVEPAKESADSTTISIKLLNRSDINLEEVVNRIKEKLPSGVPKETP